MAYFISLVAVGLMFGCVERELTITSEPEGALVYISDEEVGRTPVTVPFTWYGDYDIIVRRDGYETLDTHAKIHTPWYEVPPIDLLSALAPWTYHDRRYLHYKLEPLTLPDDEELLDQAEQMKQRTLQPVK
ncbi:MAG: PEGA domain-containing protein [Phycisphaerae bacterium]